MFHAKIPFHNGNVKIEFVRQKEIRRECLAPPHDPARRVIVRDCAEGNNGRDSISPTILMRRIESRAQPDGP